MILPGGFRQNAALVGAVGGYAWVDSAIAALPASFKLFLAALFAALGNLVIEVIRSKAAALREARELRQRAPEDAPQGVDVIPAPRDDSRAGFVRGGFAVFISGAAVLALLFTLAFTSGCSAFPGAHAEYIAPQVESGKYGDCLVTGGRLHLPPVRSVTTLVSTCVAAWDGGVSLPDASADAGEVHE